MLSLLGRETDLFFIFNCTKLSSYHFAVCTSIYLVFFYSPVDQFSVELHIVHQNKKMNRAQDLGKGLYTFFFQFCLTYKHICLFLLFLFLFLSLVSHKGFFHIDWHNALLTILRHSEEETDLYFKWAWISVATFFSKSKSDRLEVLLSPVSGFWLYWKKKHLL